MNSVSKRGKSGSERQGGQARVERKEIVQGWRGEEPEKRTCKWFQNPDLDRLRKRKQKENEAGMGGSENCCRDKKNGPKGEST